MREIFALETYTTGLVHLFLRTPSDRREQSGGAMLTEHAERGVDPALITPGVLEMLSAAYYAGYECAAHDAGEAVKRLMLENKAPRRPAAKISERRDYRGSGA